MSKIPTERGEVIVKKKKKASSNNSNSPRSNYKVIRQLGKMEDNLEKFFNIMIFPCNILLRKLDALEEDSRS